MSIINSTPRADGFYMPGEYEKHKGTVLIWPTRPGSWTNAGKEAQIAFEKIARAIAKSEEVYLLASGEFFPIVKEKFKDEKNIKVYDIKTDDAWARDVGPTCVVDGSGKVRGVDWKFNAWGGDYDGLYSDYENDDGAAFLINEAIGMDTYEARPFVLEGGSIACDGQGTVLVTETCLLSKGRNPNLSKSEIEDKLKEYLGAKKVIWLPRGIDGDETNEHVDNVCAFVKPGEVVLAWTDDDSDPQWEASKASLNTLLSEKDALGRSITVHKLLIPKEPVCITAEELAALEFAPGEDMRSQGERLAASYVNFYITNGGVLVPQFGDINDKAAVELLAKCFPKREIIPIEARAIIVGGGNIHCITQQIPEGK